MSRARATWAFDHPGRRGPVIVASSGRVGPRALVLAIVTIMLGSAVGFFALSARAPATWTAGASGSAPVATAPAGPARTDDPLSGGSSWTEFQGNGSHDGLASSDGPTSAGIGWALSTGYGASGLTAESPYLILSQGGGDGPTGGGAPQVLYEGNGTGYDTLSSQTLGTSYVPVVDGNAFFESYSCGFFSCGCDLYGDNVSTGSTAWADGVGCSPSFDTTFGWSSAAGGYGEVFFMQEAGSGLAAYTATNGATLWSVGLPGDLWGVPTVGAGLVVVGYSNLNEISALNATDGTAVWNVSLDAPLAEAVAFADGVFYLGTTYGGVVAVSAGGTVLWSVGLGTSLETTPAVAGGLVIVAGENGTLVGLNASTGATDWSLMTGGGVNASPVISANGLVYEGNASGYLWAVRAGTGAPVWTTSVGGYPTFSLALDGGYLFALTTSGELYAFPVVSYSVDFVEAGLPVGTNWSVTLAGSAGSSNTSTIDLEEPSGEYAFSLLRYLDVDTVWYAVTPWSGTVEVANATVTVNLTFSKATVASLTFREAGLPRGHPWNVSVGWPGDNATRLGVGTSLSLTAPEGTLPLDLASAGYPVSSVTGPGLLGQHRVTVSGPATFHVTFGHVESLTFQERGLGSGIAWTVALAPTVSGGPAGQNQTTTNSSVTFTVTSDPYRWTVTPSTPVYEAVPEHGTVGVGLSAKSVKVTFKELTSKVTFEEKGLPSHSHWSVTIPGLPELNGTGAAIVLHLPNGTYDYTIATTRAGYTTDQPTGTVTVSAPKALKVTVVFTRASGG